MTGRSQTLLWRRGEEGKDDRKQNILAPLVTLSQMHSKTLTLSPPPPPPHAQSCLHQLKHTLGHLVFFKD